MRSARVVESVDINAPCDEVFEVVANCDRRLQLSPLWGETEVEVITADFPREGSSYHVKSLVEGHKAEYETIVSDYVANQKFAYRSTAECQSHSSWTLQDTARGTRLIYDKEFLVDEDEAEKSVQTTRETVREWLENIRRYAELRDGRGRRFVRWLADRYFLRMSMEQRRAILAVIVLQGLSCVSFVALGLGLAVASLLF